MSELHPKIEEEIRGEKGEKVDKGEGERGRSGDRGGSW